ADARDGLGPLERRALTIAEERRLPPGVERVEALLGFACVPGVLGVHVDAVRAAVDLRRADLDELEQPRVQPGRCLARQSKHRLAEAGVQVFGEVDSGRHVSRLLGYLPRRRTNRTRVTPTR